MRSDAAGPLVTVEVPHLLGIPRVGKPTRSGVRCGFVLDRQPPSWPLGARWANSDPIEHMSLSKHRMVQRRTLPGWYVDSGKGGRRDRVGIFDEFGDILQKVGDTMQKTDPFGPVGLAGEMMSDIVTVAEATATTRVISSSTKRSRHSRRRHPSQAGEGRRQTRTQRRMPNNWYAPG